MSQIGLHVKVSRMSIICDCTERTIRSWRSGKTMMPYDCLALLANEAGVPVPEVTKIGRYAHTSRAGQIGSAVVLKKYGRVPVNEKIRKESWQNWFINGGRIKVSESFTKNIKVPEINEELAEFIGIMLGDGGMTKFQITVTLHRVDDLKYSDFVKKRIKELFGVSPSLYSRKDVNVICVALARRKAVEYLCSLGLVIGNKVKQKICVPSWILENEKYSLACMRGLMDTDGSMYIHRYSVGGKEYRYKKLCFSSASEPLRKDVLFILHRFGSAATCSGTNVRIDSIADVKRYMEVIGTNNPKHLKRYSK